MGCKRSKCVLVGNISMLASFLLQFYCLFDGSAQYFLKRKARRKKSSQNNTCNRRNLLFLKNTFIYCFCSLYDPLVGTEHWGIENAWPMRIF